MPDDDVVDVSPSDDLDLDFVDVLEQVEQHHIDDDHEHELRQEAHARLHRAERVHEHRIKTDAEILFAVRAAGLLSDEPADVPDDYVYSDGATKRDVLAAIQAAGLVENYTLTEQLRVRYNLLVCVRCASADATVPFHNLRDSWGSVCEPCAQLIGTRAAQRWAQSL
jgi:hypothetical protein